MGSEYIPKAGDFVKIGEQIGIVTHRDGFSEKEGFSFVAVQPNGLVQGFEIYGLDLSDLIDLNPEQIEVPSTIAMAIALYAIRSTIYPRRSLSPKDIEIYAVIDNSITKFAL